MTFACVLLCLSSWAGAQTPAEFTVSSYTALAFSASPELRSAEAAYEAAARREKSRLGSMMLPTFAFSGRAQPWGDNPDNANRFQTWRLNRNEMTFDSTLNLNLFNSFQDWQRWRSARLSREAAERSFWAARQDRAFAAINSFYSLNSKDQLLEVARQNLKAQEDQYKQTLDLYRNGMKSLADLLKSETDLRSSELRLISAESEQKSALVDFNSLLDRAGLDGATLKVDLAPGATALPELPGDLAKAVAQRPELVRARKELELARVAAQQAVQDALPTFKADATWSRTDAATFGGAPSDTRPRYFIGLSLALPANFNLLSQAYAAAAARAERRRAASALALAVRQVRQEVYESFIRLERALKLYAIALQKAEISRRSLELVGAQYRQGTADAIRMNQAQSDFLSAQVERTLALHDIFIDRARYRRAVGDPLW